MRKLWGILSAQGRAGTVCVLGTPACQLYLGIVVQHPVTVLVSASPGS